MYIYVIKRLINPYKYYILGVLHFGLHLTYVLHFLALIFEKCML